MYSSHTFFLTGYTDPRTGERVEIDIDTLQVAVGTDDVPTVSITFPYPAGSLTFHFEDRAKVAQLFQRMADALADDSTIAAMRRIRRLTDEIRAVRNAAAEVRRALSEDKGAASA